jgi:hypothetical protein
MYGFLAGVVMILHFCFILLVVCGGLLAIRWKKMALVHLPAVIWAIFLELRPGTLCPLTPLEQALRRRAGEITYTGGFIDHYVGPLIYPDMTSHDQQLIGLALLLFTLLVYCGVFIRWKATRK